MCCNFRSREVWKKGKMYSKKNGKPVSLECYFIGSKYVNNNIRSYFLKAINMKTKLYATYLNIQIEKYLF